MADADDNDDFFGTTHSIQCGWAWKWGCLRAHVQQVSRELLNRKRAPSWNVTCCVNLVRVVPVLALFMFWSHSAIRNYKETRSGSWSDFVRPPKGVGTGCAISFAKARQLSVDSFPNIANRLWLWCVGHRPISHFLATNLCEHKVDQGLINTTAMQPSRIRTALLYGLQESDLETADGNWNVTVCVNLCRAVPVLPLFKFRSHTDIKNYKGTHDPTNPL